MTASKDMRHPDTQLVFMGRVVASYSHEIKNILAIINESTGLMHDLLNLKQEGLDAHAQRFSKVLEDIGQQILRGQELSTFLNTLAHAPDKEVDGVDVIRSMQAVFALSSRLVKNASMRVRLDQGASKLYVNTRPVECMQCIFCALEWAMSQSQAGDEIVFRPRDATDGVQITVSGWSVEPGAAEEDQMTSLQDAVSALQGTCALQGKELVIALPRQIETY
ncbi:HAMP domain-containing histidine kinase [Desulfovermiculus halophilus]|jgi:hypothetical protein|uniref:HAMP domain-containing histidine kinase n=1 Tax=Desulfovermiculus halophilus TaxID=339722 RepID=UPI00048508D0|nr:HAMP domain-containing histidine kinase [Desulfovermiculus halophilus]